MMTRVSWLIEVLDPISDDEIDILKEHTGELMEAADKAVDDGKKPSEAIIAKAEEVLGRKGKAND